VVGMVVVGTAVPLFSPDMQPDKTLETKRRHMQYRIADWRFDIVQHLLGHHEVLASRGVAREASATVYIAPSPNIIRLFTTGRPQKGTYVKNNA